jgi:serine/threonine protein kinase
LNEFAPIQQVDPFAASLAGRRLGRYEVLARLATGGMAAVYIARAIGVAGFERLFAVKVLHPHLAHEEEFVTMFLDEARLAARIRHPNVVATIDISDTQDAGYYLVMDYVEGDHLGALMREASKTREHRLPTDSALRIVVDALGGLAAAHELTDDSGRPLNLVHRDISPQNIMVGVDGIARLTDFGVAKAETRLSSTREGQFKGKLAYMSPEHASEGYTDQRSDVFAMATILWECLTGHRLFRAENHAATLNKVCLEPIPLLSSVYPALTPFDAILEKGLARNPDERFQSATDFMEAIEERARDIGGIGTKRTVGSLVKDLAAEKIENDRELIRTGVEAVKIRAVSAASPAPQQQPPPVPVAPPVQADEYASPAAVAGPEAAQPVSPGYADAVAQYAQAPGKERAKLVWLVVGGIVLVLVLGVSVAVMVASRTSEGITTSPLQPTSVSTPEPVAAPEPPEAASVAGKEPTASPGGEATEEAEQEPAEKKDDEARAAAEKSRADTGRKHLKKRAAPKVERTPTRTSQPTREREKAERRREREPAKRTVPKRKVDDIFDNPYR